MNACRLQAFMNALNLDIAVERVGDNETIPARWREGSDHYRLMLSRPGTREFYFQFSTRGTREVPPTTTLIFLMASVMADYEAAPSPEAMAVRTGLPLEDVAEQFHTFEQERRDLMRFLGERYAEFLELARD